MCAECGEPFEPIRRSQRFCSARCANRQRDRRRRRRTTASLPTAPAASRNDSAMTAAASPGCQDRARVRLAPAHARSGRFIDSLRAQLRLQSVDIERLEAENAEQRAIVKSLRHELARLQATQESDTRDLVHLAGKLLALSRATGVDLDHGSKELFRRRGWSSSGRRGQQP